ncbi:hypothetical protein [Paralimibaculum aggregatum]|uniref:hypothetical protein n=1 Tax=Paralimibaculum aggregatum TaxID=3036245 RepID=UPI002556D719|nr:hypothetical protein [Limibaculum sp. NKW23]
MRGRAPTGRFRTCQPLIWKIRCTVFLLKPSSQATVRQPKAGSFSISTLIGSATAGSTFGGALAGLSQTVRRGTPNQAQSLVSGMATPSASRPSWSVRINCRPPAP